MSVRGNYFKIVLLVVVSALGLLAFAATDQASAVKRCSDVPGSGSQAGYDIEARGMSCRQAKTVVRAFTDEVAIGGPVKRVDAAGYSFRCRTKRIGFETYRTKCSAKSGSRRLIASFTWGF
ncbi:MAG TPA: hypothetical protein VFN15_06180 [Solirubrobacterales bacterium]|nr:hypothetical protein [Solirubrobacterales bacterium]